MTEYPLEVGLSTLSGNRTILRLQEPYVSPLVERKRKLLAASLKINGDDEDSLEDQSRNGIPSGASMGKTLPEGIMYVTHSSFTLA